MGCFWKNKKTKLFKENWDISVNLSSNHSLCVFSGIFFKVKVISICIPLLLPLTFERKYYSSLVTLRSSNSPQISFSVIFIRFLIQCIMMHIVYIIVRFELPTVMRITNTVLQSEKVVYFFRKKEKYLQLLLIKFFLLYFVPDEYVCF